MLIVERNDTNFKTDILNPTITIFHCGHFYHTICFQQIKGEFSTCPTCNPLRNSTSKNNSNNEFFKMEKYQSLNLNSSATSEINDKTLFTNDRIQFSKEQVNSLKLVRSRRIKPFVLDEKETNSNEFLSPFMHFNKPNIQKKFPGSELALAPANISKYA